MSLVVEPIETRQMTAEEFLALPEDGVSRELIRGVLRERPMTVRNRFHAVATVNLAFLLKLWLKGQPEPRGQIVGGDAGFWLRGTKESVVGIDVAYASADLVAASGPKDRVFHGPPLLAVEIISPSDTHEDIVEKVAAYLEVGTIAWLVDPDFRHVIIHRPGQDAELLNVNHELTTEPQLPGFRAPVAAIFEA